MDGRCPFRWNRNVSRAGRAYAERGNKLRRRLMEYGDCEKWFWSDSGEGIGMLFEICSTLLINLLCCFDDVREILNSGGNGIPRGRSVEFNRICGDCPSGRFVTRRTAGHV